MVKGSNEDISTRVGRIRERCMPSGGSILHWEGDLRRHDILAESLSQACKGIGARRIWEDRIGIREGSPKESGQVGGWGVAQQKKRK